MKILLLGAAGQLGQSLSRSLSDLGPIDALTRAQLDLTDIVALRKLIRERRPDLIINAAAYTAVDLAESQIAQAFLINATIPEVLAQEAQDLEIPLIHFSTDYVFDGKNLAPYTEHDQTNPLNVYGRSKLAGEQAIARHSSCYWIFRTSWLYSRNGGNFLNTVLKLAQTRPSIDVVDDQWGTPTWTNTISKALSTVLQREPSETLRKTMHTCQGIYHLTSHGETNWNAYARKIVRITKRLGLSNALDENAIRAVSSTDYGVIAPRPQNSTLNNSKFEMQFSICLPTWENALETCLLNMPTAHIRRATSQNTLLLMRPEA